MFSFNKRGRAAAMLLATTILAAPFVAAPLFHSTPAEARAQFQSYADLVAAAKPAVVTVKTTTSAPDMSSTDFQQFDGPFGEFFRKFFQDRGGQFGQPFGNQQPDQPNQGHAPQGHALGSGFIVDSSGVIVTNRHVIENATEVSIEMDDGTELPATIVGADEKTDIAVLRVKSDKPLPTVPWGNSDEMRVGDGVIAIGNPFGLGGTVTSGIVSARGRDIHSGPYDDFIQIDAAINRGNSGGPLFNEQGQVIGVNTAIVSPSGGNIGLGFAIPSNQARDVADQILENGHVERGMIAVTIQPVTREIADGLGLKKAEGALVASVIADGPAAKAGVKPGDVILAFGDTHIGEVRDLTRAVAATAAGTSEKLTVWRGGEERDLSVEVERMTAEKTAALSPSAPADNAKVSVASLGLMIATAPDGHGAIVTSVDPSSLTAEAGVRAGDRIVAVNQSEVGGAGDVERLVAEARSSDRRSVLLLIERGDSALFVGVPFGDA